MRLALVVMSLWVGASASDLPVPRCVTSQPAESDRTTSSGLAMGPHAVGFSVLALPGGAGRLFVWRPIARAGAPLTLGAFADAVCPGRADDLAACFPNVAGSAGTTGRSSALRRMELRASLGGAPQGRHPVVLLMGSIDSRGGELLGVAEALASQGLVVAEVLPPPQAATRALDLRAAELAADRGALALARLDSAGGADTTRVGIAAWSFGGVPAMISASRDRRVVALVSFDSALRYAYGTALLAAANVAPGRVRARVYSVTAGSENSVAKDDRLVGALPGLDARTIGGALSHADFCDQYGAWAAYADGRESQERFHARYRAAVEPALTFLQHALTPGR